MSEALNVTKAAFRSLREVTTSHLWQYDYGQILQITGLDLPQAFEVHFSNSRKSGETVTQIGADNQVTIPDMFLTSGADIYCFIFLHDGLTDGETEYVIKIPVRERPEPSDIEPTPEQQSAIDEAIAALNTAVTQTAADVTAADASARAAAQSATNAQTAAQSAQSSATSASGSASTASTAAATATQKASEAATSAANAASAQTAAETAQTAAESAQASAQSAANTATAKASEASTSATNASGSASAASASASQASESATSAANSATAASGSATSAATSASTASTKASEASASATAAQTAQTAAEAAQTAAQTAQTAAEAAQTAAETAQAAAEAARDETIAEAATIRGDLKNKADIIISTAKGSIATFEDGANDMPMVSCVAKIEPVQSGSGDPSPDNVRPISGWTGCNVVVSPTEFAEDGTTYPISWQSEAGTVYGGTLDVVSGLLTVDRLSVDLGSLTWRTRKTETVQKFLSAPLPSPYVTAYSIMRGWLSDRYIEGRPTGTAIMTNVDEMDIGVYSYRQSNGTSTTVYAIVGVGDTPSGQLVYTIAEPQTYQLTPTEVRTLLGLNNVWADTGDVEVQYRADTKLYIDGKGTDWAKLIAPTEADYTATRAYTSGSLLIVGSQLYKATTAIANGATLTVGTNITATTLAEVIAAL